MQEAVDAALLEKVETSIERNKSLQMLGILHVHDSVDAVLKGAHGNTSLKKLIIIMLSRDHLKAAPAELQKVRPELELVVA